MSYGFDSLRIKVATVVTLDLDGQIESRPTLQPTLPKRFDDISANHRVDVGPDSA